MRPNTYLLFLIFCISVIAFQSCTDYNTEGAGKRVNVTPCSCKLTEEEMFSLCPIDASGDSILICKVGTNNVIGSHRPPMTWPEYIASDYFGAEGELVNCKTGERLLSTTEEPILSYKNKKLIVDERMRLDVFNSRNNTWIDLDIPTWRKVVYAVKSEIRISPDSLIFKPPLQNARAFAAASKEYEEEEKRTDHYLIARTANRLLICSLNGDTLSERRLLNLENRFSDYYSAHAEYKKILDEQLRLLQAYTSYIQQGGRREYFDLSVYPYFQDSIKAKVSR